jgi:hypothetical protein
MWANIFNIRENRRAGCAYLYNWTSDKHQITLGIVNRTDGLETH